MEWTKESVTQRLAEINAKGFIPIPQMMFRRDDGVVGQILEREFGVSENNIHLADLGTFELKGMRIKKNRTGTLTLFHQTSSDGLTPLQIFDRFGYERKSNRSEIIKKKLFTTIKGERPNSLGLMLKADSEDGIELYYHDEYLARWDLSASRHKIEQVILAFAETRGAPNTSGEEFHYTKAFLLDDLRSISEAIRSGAVVMDLCIDQPADKSKRPHDRGPHIRISVRKLDYLYRTIEQLL